jgi:hypothetical protein
MQQCKKMALGSVSSLNYVPINQESVLGQTYNPPDPRLFVFFSVVEEFYGPRY